jgi:hypothetical protein
VGQAQKAPKAQKAENAKNARLECEAEHSVKEESHAGKAERALFLLAYPLAACYLEYVMSTVAINLQDLQKVRVQVDLSRLPGNSHLVERTTDKSGDQNGCGYVSVTLAGDLVGFFRDIIRDKEIYEEAVTVYFDVDPDVSTEVRS